jgi:hypothetical protein
MPVTESLTNRFKAGIKCSFHNAKQRGSHGMASGTHQQPHGLMHLGAAVGLPGTCHSHSLHTICHTDFRSRFNEMVSIPKVKRFKSKTALRRGIKLYPPEDDNASSHSGVFYQAAR